MTKATELRDIADFANRCGERFENEQASILYGEWVGRMEQLARRGMYRMRIAAYPKEDVECAIIERAKKLLTKNGFSVSKVGEEPCPRYGDSVDEDETGARICFFVSWKDEKDENC